jgi:menaquinol-cytochrome c reductase iron-sulfur subunit
MTVSDANGPKTPPIPRRSFVKEGLAAGLGILLGIFPFFAGLAVFLDPLRRRGNGPGKPILVTTLDSLPEDNIPRKFSVTASRSDAWNRFAQVPIGAVYLRRGATGVTALNVVCPHAGCFVDFPPGRGEFLCPCHNSTFGLDGRVNDPRSPAARRMDDLKVEIKNGKEVWVAFQNFQAGTSKKIPA